MRYRRLKPCEALAPFVEGIWVLEDLNSPPTEQYRTAKVVPAASMEMVFMTGDDVFEIKHDGRILHPRCSLSGLKTTYKEYIASGQTSVIVVRFKSWGVYPFFRLPMHEFMDENVDLRLVLQPNTIDVLEDKLREAGDTAERIPFIQSFLLALLDAPQIDQLVLKSARDIQTSGGSIPIHVIARELPISKRQFERRFKQVIGLTPKKFSTMIRFQKAIYYKNMKRAWTDIAGQAGYYDQAHLIKDFRRLAGVSPEGLVQTTPATSLAKYLNQAMSPFYNTVYI